MCVCVRVCACVDKTSNFTADAVLIYSVVFCNNKRKDETNSSSQAAPYHNEDVLRTRAIAHPMHNW